MRISILSLIFVVIFQSAAPHPSPVPLGAGVLSINWVALQVGLWHSMLCSVFNGMHVIFIPYSVMKVNPASWMHMITRFKGIFLYILSRCSPLSNLFQVFSFTSTLILIRNVSAWVILVWCECLSVCGEKWESVEVVKRNTPRWDAHAEKMKTGVFAGKLWAS